MSKRLAIIAGKGALPYRIALSAHNDGYDVVVMPISGQADDLFSDFETVPIHLGSIARTRREILNKNISTLVMAGKVEWPSMTSLRPDFDGVKLLGKMITRGDDTALRLIKKYFAEKDIEIVSAHQFLPDHRLPVGVLTGAPLTSEEQLMLEQGLGVLETLGGYDVGQSVVIQNRRIIAVEAAEGTDAMLTRCGALLKPGDGTACFIKTAKSNQDKSLDTPVIGCRTIEVASEAGIKLVAIESGAVLLADDLAAIRDRCIDLKVTLIGIDVQSK